jgi:putative tricarboxylic transport membrane protein
VLGRDGLAGLICLGGSLWLLGLTRGLPQPALVPIGPGFYPRIVLTLMAVLSAVLVVTDLVSNLRRRPRSPAGPGGGGGDTTGPRKNYLLVALTFGAFAAYVVLLPPLGYRVATFLFVAVLQVLLAPAGERGWISLIAVALATAFVTHLVFEGYLSVLLPRGRWTGL